MIICRTTDADRRFVLERPAFDGNRLVGMEKAQYNHIGDGVEYDRQQKRFGFAV